MDGTLVIPVELKIFLGFKQIISIQIQNIQKLNESKYKLIFEIVALGFYCYCYLLFIISEGKGDFKIQSINFKYYLCHQSSVFLQFVVPGQQTYLRIFNYYSLRIKKESRNL